MPLLADEVGLVGLHPVIGVAILVGEHRDGPVTEFIGGTEGTDGDLTSVGDKDLLKHAPRLGHARRCKCAERCR